MPAPCAPAKAGTAAHCPWKKTAPARLTMGTWITILDHSHETGWEWYLSSNICRDIDHSIFDTTRIKMGKLWHVPEYIPTCLSWSTGFDQNTVEVHTQYVLMTFTKLVRAHLRGYRLNPTTHNVATHLAQFQELPLLPGRNVMKDFLGQDSWATAKVTNLETFCSRVASDCSSSFLLVQKKRKKYHRSCF